MSRLAAAVILALALPCAHAATYTVTRFDDPAPGACLPGDCSLREAVNAASATPAADSIVLGSGDYSLTRIDTTPDTPEAARGALLVSGSLQIEGAGTTRTRIAWNTAQSHHNAVFRSGDTAQGALALQLANLEVANGRGSSGGCIHAVGNDANPAAVVLDRVVVTQCEADFGGAIHMSLGQLVLRSTVLRDNRASFGGALDLMRAVQVQTEKADIRDNHAVHDGGGVRILGIPLIPTLTEVTWVDDGYSTIRGNVAGRDGGGIVVEGPAAIDLSTREDSPQTRLLTLSGNRATGVGGGLDFGGYWLRQDWIDRVHRVRFEGNTAFTGGGVYVSTELVLSDSEIVGNVAEGGNGGGVARGALQSDMALALERVSVRNNQASSGAGGGVWTDCGVALIDDSALSGNRAAGHTGQGIDALGMLEMRHVTMNGNGVSPAPGLRKRYATNCIGNTLRYANSLILDRCSASVAGELVSGGGNQLGPSASTCPATQGMDQRQSSNSVFALVDGLYGGDFTVPGFKTFVQPPPQRNFGLASECTATDIRGKARSTRSCDAGAFEE